MESEHLLRKFNLISNLSTKNRSVAIIASNIMHKYQEQAVTDRVSIDSGPMCCKWCFNFWTPGNFSVELHPQKIPKRQVRSLIKKDIDSLNNFQKQFVERINKCKIGNSLAVKCGYCQKTSNVPLKKGIKEVKSKNEPACSPSLTEATRKKKRKKKDVFAGLNAAAVQSVKPPSNEVVRNVKSKPSVLKRPREISFRQQMTIHRALINTPVQKKKTSLLDSFLSNM